MRWVRAAGCWMRVSQEPRLTARGEEPHAGEHARGGRVRRPAPRRRAARRARQLPADQPLRVASRQARVVHARDCGCSASRLGEQLRARLRRPHAHGQRLQTAVQQVARERVQQPARHDAHLAEPARPTPRRRRRRRPSRRRGRRGTWSRCAAPAGALASGRCSTGVAKVLSTSTGTPPACATTPRDVHQRERGVRRRLHHDQAVSGRSASRTRCGLRPGRPPGPAARWRAGGPSRRTAAAARPRARPRPRAARRQAVRAAMPEPKATAASAPSSPASASRSGRRWGCTAARRRGCPEARRPAPSRRGSRRPRRAPAAGRWWRGRAAGRARRGQARSSRPAWMARVSKESVMERTSFWRWAAGALKARRRHHSIE